MNRRSFIKRLGALVGLAHANPVALIPEVPSYITVSMPIGNQLVRPETIASEALALLEEDLCMRYIRPAAEKLAENIDKDIANQLMRRN